MSELLCVVCKNPDADTKVLETRQEENGRMLRRKRKCLNCGSAFFTYEFPVDPEKLKVKKRGGDIEPYDYNKLHKSLKEKTFRGRRPTDQEIGRLASAVTTKVMHLNKDIVTSQEIAEIVLPELLKIDVVAYNRYLAYYRDDYSSLDEYKALLDNAPAVKRLRKPRAERKE